MSSILGRIFDSVPASLHRSDSESSTSSTASSQTIGTPFDRIRNRADGDLGGERGLTADTLVGAITELLSEQQPLLDGPAGGIQPRFTHEEVQQLCTTLKEDYSLKIETKPVHVSRLDYKPSSYHITIPTETTRSVGGQESAPPLRRNFGCLALSQFGAMEPRPTPEYEDEVEVEKMDEHVFNAAVDSKLNGIVDDKDALYF
ncbi:hypothetical protein NCC49_001572 [Naganishia albida]|nr:hypothetical protein NCC49_001572 [Naganishia albida]